MPVWMMLALCRNFYKVPLIARDHGWAVREEEVKICQARCFFMHYCSPHIEVKHFSVAITCTSTVCITNQGGCGEAVQWLRHGAKTQLSHKVINKHVTTMTLSILRHVAHNAPQTEWHSFQFSCVFFFFSLYSCIISTGMQNVICFFI